jgi:phosphatidylserine decarboxylase
MPFSYIPKTIHRNVALLLFVCWIFNLVTLFIFLGVIYSLGLFFFRRHNKKIQDAPRSGNLTIYSPLNGKVVSITKGCDHDIFGKDLIEMRLSIPFFKEMGLFIPTNSEVIDLQVNRGQKALRFKKNLEKISSQTGLCLAFKSSNGCKFGMQLIPCAIGMWPEVALLPGDKGKLGANMGYFPFGGTVLLYLPKESEVLISESAQLIAAETLLAGYSN